MISRSVLRALTDELVSKLAEGAKLYQNDPREAAIGSLVAVAGFVADLERGERHFAPERDFELALPLMRLTHALVSMTEGVKDPLLEIPVGSGRKGVPISFVMARADAAGAMNVLMASGLREREAAQRVARCIADADFTRGMDKLPTAIINWRKQIVALNEARMIQDLPAAPDWEYQAAGIYNLATEAGRARLKQPGATPERVQDFILKRLRRRNPRATKWES